jgi:predicted AAA+ superfamily ATPase
LFLCSWDSPDSLKNGARNGSMLETYVFSEILKSYLHAMAINQIYILYRDKDQKEIDFIIEEDINLHPIEVKKL